MEAVEPRMTAQVLPWTRPAAGERLLPGKDSLAEAIWIAFVVVQALDGAMTFIGMDRFGVRIEANPLLMWYVQAFGPALALAAAKLFAIGCGAALYLTAHHKTLAALALMYVVGAIGPWIHVFWSHQ
jgi:hypothetical protein